MNKIKILIIITSIISVLLICAIIILNISNEGEENITNNNFNIGNINNSISNNMSNGISNNIDDNTTSNIVNNIQENLINNNIQDNNTTVGNTQIKPQAVKSREDFYTVKSCIDEYINYIVTNNSEALYNILDKYYMQQNNINQNNILEKLVRINEYQVFAPTRMNYIELNNKQIYMVYGKIREDKLNERANEVEFNLTVTMNKQNNSYSIIPEIISETTSYSLIGNNTRNKYNLYSTVSIDNKTMANIYFVDYKTELLYNLQNAYNLLDEEYSRKRFNGYSNFYQYVQDNINKINRANLTKYSITNDGNNTIFTCIDQYNNYYIFEETAIMQYKVILDDYTIDSNEFITKYNAASFQEKMELNIQKFIKMINSKDYENAYNLLNTEFKNNNFIDLQQFINYVTTSFYNYNDVRFNTFSTQGDIGIYEININGVVNDIDVTQTKTIIMKLGTGTNFEISFDI